MTHLDPTGTEWPESYPSFWDAIPVDVPVPTPAGVTVNTPVEDGGRVFLAVEQSDVGLI